MNKFVVVSLIVTLYTTNSFAKELICSGRSEYSSGASFTVSYEENSDKATVKKESFPYVGLEGVHKLTVTDSEIRLRKSGKVKNGEDEIDINHLTVINRLDGSWSFFIEGVSRAAAWGECTKASQRKF